MLIKSFIILAVLRQNVKSLQRPFPCHCAQATQLVSKKGCSDGEPLATLCPIWPARNLTLRPRAPETKALPLDQLAGKVTVNNFNSIKNLAGMSLTASKRNTLCWEFTIDFKNIRFFFLHLCNRGN